MTPARSSSASSAVDEMQISSSSKPTVFVTVNVTPSPSFVTTTVTSSGAGSLPTEVGAVQRADTSNVPVAAIASGTAAGVLIALVAVIGWTWWGRCIKRKNAKERKEALAYLEVRENTRKNASSLSYPASQYRPGFSISGGQHGRKVTFVSNGPASSQSTLRGAVEQKKGAANAEKPARTSQLAATSAQSKDAIKKTEAHLPPPPPPPLPRRNPHRERAPILAPTEASLYTQHRLMHQASTLSSGSVYSTQSAIEEGQTDVPSSLLLALTSESNRRSLLASYLPWNRNRTSTVSNNRLSEYSTGSVYSQFDDQPWESVGFAYGGEDETSKR